MNQTHIHNIKTTTDAVVLWQFSATCGGQHDKSGMMHALLLMKNDILVPRLSNLDYQYNTEF